jgi:hypothetical protein
VLTLKRIWQIWSIRDILPSLMVLLPEMEDGCDQKVKTKAKLAEWLKQ